MDLRVTPRPVQSQIVNKLRDAILSGYFQPGERLVETTLCKIANVGRGSIREALRRLEGERLIVIVPNRGPSVAEITWEEAEEIYQVRALLEPEATALFVARATKTDLRKMRVALRRFAKAAERDDPMERLRSTTDFYEPILAGCGNRTIREVLEALLARINLLRSRSMSKKGRPKYSLREMSRILDAIEAGDPKAARKAALDHINAARAAAREAFAPAETT